MIACQGFSPFATSWESSWPVADGWGWCTGLPVHFTEMLQASLCQWRGSYGSSKLLVLEVQP